MILELTFSNFYSFREEAQISFEVGKKPMKSGFDIESEKQRINKAIAVVGANGAGKTQFAKALAFLGWFVVDSFVKTKPGQDIPLSSFILDPQKPTNFSIRFLLKGKEYKLEFSVQENRIIKEALYQNGARAFSYLYVREWQGDRYEYKHKGFSFLEKQAVDVRHNASILAAAYSFDVPEAKPFQVFFEAFVTNIHASGRHNFSVNELYRSASYYADFPNVRTKMSQALSEFDLGINEVTIRKQAVLDAAGTEQDRYVPYAMHTSGESDFELPLFLESSGTQSAFSLLTNIIPILEYGGIAIIDEIDNDLHPHMLPKILDWFRFEHTNPHNAQILFTCHTPEVLNILMKHQVYLVEKTNQSSEAWRLDDVKGLRADDNLYAKYMAGALSAVPNL